MAKEKELLTEKISGVFLPTNYVSEYNKLPDVFKTIEEKLTPEQQEIVKETLEKELTKSLYSSNFSYNIKQDRDSLVNAPEVKKGESSIRLENKEAIPKVKKQGKLKGKGIAMMAANASGNSPKNTKWYLFNSGFWITIKPIGIDDRIHLETRLVNEIVDIGVDTLGLIFSNDQAAIRSILLDFLRPYINTEKSSLKFEENDDPYDYISSLDADILIAALVYNIYPTGFPMTLVCKNNLNMVIDGVDVHSECNNVLEGTVNPLETIYADMDSLTEEQINILSMGQGSIYKGTEEEYLEDPEIGFSIKDYQEDMGSTKVLAYEKGTFGIVDDIKIYLGTGTINHMQSSADKFIIDLKTKIDDVIIELVDEDDKKIVAEEFMDTVLLNKYLHFITRIDIGENWSDDMYDIYDALNELRSNNELAIDIITKITEFIDEKILYVVGHPKFECSKCKKVSNEEDTVENKNLESIIPYNILYVFMILRVMS